MKNVVQDLTSAGVDWQREKWQSGFGSKFIRQGEKNAVKYADEIIVLSKGVQDYFKETYGRETHFIPNGVNRPQIRKANLITEKFGLKRDSYILFLGRLVPEKGIRYLFEAFKNVKTDKKLVIAGGSSDTDSFMTELKELAKDDNRILFTGFVQGAMLDELYSNAYIYTLPSDLEGMPLSLLEAMSYGNCCLVSDIPECAEVVEDKALIFKKADGEYLKTKELYDSVFDERKYLIEDQPEYFYRSYIDFTLAHQFDLTPALRCFVEHSDEFKDIFIYMSFEMDLKFATCTFNDPDQMLDDVKILLDEGLYTEADYNEKCLIINMLNCRPVQAEQYAGWAHGMHPLLSSKYERMLLVWKGAQVMPNTHWNSMQQWIASQMFDVYKKEKWLRNPKDILFESCTSENKAIVVDLWTLYFFVKVQAQEVMSHFKTIYITYECILWWK